MVKKKPKAKPKKLKKPAKPKSKINVKVKHKIKHNVKHKVKAKVTPKTKLELLKEGCRLWDKITTKAYQKEYPIPKEINRFKEYDEPQNKGKLYSSGDYGALQCKITGSLAELTVGSSSGHKAKVNLDNHTLQYFDPRNYNNWTMWEILKPLKCKRDDLGVQCTGIKTRAQILHVFRAMAMPTSMDYRQSHCESEHTGEECRKSELKFFKSGPMHTVVK